MFASDSTRLAVLRQIIGFLFWLYFGPISGLVCTSGYGNSVAGYGGSCITVPWAWACLSADQGLEQVIWRCWTGLFSSLLLLAL